VGLVGLVVQGVVNLALTSQSDAALQAQPISWRDGLQRGLSRFMPYIGMSLIKYISIGLVGFVGYFLVVCAMIAVVLGGGGIFGSFVENSDPSGSDMVAMVGLGLLFVCLGFLGVLALLSPVFYLLARWLVTLPGLVTLGMQYARNGAAKAV